jgi:hypothetical protein
MCRRAIGASVSQSQRTQLLDALLSVARASGGDAQHDRLVQFRDWCVPDGIAVPVIPSLFQIQIHAWPQDPGAAAVRLRHRWGQRCVQGPELRGRRVQLRPGRHCRPGMHCGYVPGALRNHGHTQPLTAACRLSRKRIRCKFGRFRKVRFWLSHDHRLVLQELAASHAPRHRAARTLVVLPVRYTTARTVPSYKKAHDRLRKKIRKEYGKLNKPVCHTPPLSPLGFRVSPYHDCTAPLAPVAAGRRGRRGRQPGPAARGGCVGIA